MCQRIIECCRAVRRVDHATVVVEGAVVNYCAWVVLEVETFCHFIRD